MSSKYSCWFLWVEVGQDFLLLLQQPVAVFARLVQGQCLSDHLQGRRVFFARVCTQARL